MKKLVALALAVLVLSGCSAAAGGLACKVIDLADTTCPLVVQFVDSDGGTQQMKISHEDARQLSAHKAAMKKAAESKTDPSAKSQWP